MRLLFWIVALPVLFAGAFFAVSNRDPVGVDLWPFWGRVELPLYLVVAAAFYAGFVFGGVVAWWAGRARRAQGRRAQWRASQLAREKADLEARLARHAAASSAAALPAPGKAA